MARNRRSHNRDDRPRPRPGFEGVVISARPAWIKRRGKPAKYYDTRVEYDDGYEVGIAQLFLPAASYLPVGTSVRVVRSRNGELSVLPDRQEKRVVAPGASWRKPDLKGVLLAVIIGVVVIGALVATVALVLYNSQDRISDIIKEGPTTSGPSTSGGSSTPTDQLSPTPTSTPS